MKAHIDLILYPNNQLTGKGVHHVMVIEVEDQAALDRVLSGLGEITNAKAVRVIRPPQKHLAFSIKCNRLIEG